MVQNLRLTSFSVWENGLVVIIMIFEIFRDDQKIVVIVNSSRTNKNYYRTSYHTEKLVYAELIKAI